MSTALPKILVDQSLGSVRFPNYLRSKGCNVDTIKGTFGQSDIEDVIWIQFVGENELIAITKDKAISRRPHEKASVISSCARIVCYANQNKGFEEISEVFDKHWGRLVKWFKKPSPWFIVVRDSEIESLKLV